ncbi:hypothetical protein EX30DRAFT_225577 [Ascodesmis nigricans]|uniref:PIN domain-containing protein n=1 Tax=Ascodesmis nigricans TaxID=341454 RepID=A0A4S2MJB7_9PEZI|nr:hypothetical protein EX30DRAFT_225577 [Ascodesmis nigricans]
MTELNGLKCSPDIGPHARAAEYAVSNAIAKRSNMKICTAQGNNMSHWGAMREKLPTDENRDRDSNTDDAILLTTKKVREKRNVELGPPQAAEESAILLTEDIQLRVKATVNGVVALNTIMLKKYLFQLRDKQMAEDPVFAAKVAKEKGEQEKKIMQDGKRGVKEAILERETPLEVSGDWQEPHPPRRDPYAAQRKRVVQRLVPPTSHEAMQAMMASKQGGLCAAGGAAGGAADDADAGGAGNGTVNAGGTGRGAGKSAGRGGFQQHSGGARPGTRRSCAQG